MEVRRTDKTVLHAYFFGEANAVCAENAEEWAGESQKKLNMIIQFEHVGLWDTNPERRIDLLKVKDIFTRWQNELENRGWNALLFENHDVPRIISKWGAVKNFWLESATSIATMYFMMQGTPFIYQSQEIGMTNTLFDGPEDLNDVSAKNAFRIKRAKGETDAEITAELTTLSRDNARTPMQVSPFVHGTYALLLPDHEQTYAYSQTTTDEKFIVIANLSDKNAQCDFQELDFAKAKLVLGNYPQTAAASSKLELRPFESRIYQL